MPTALKITVDKNLLARFQDKIKQFPKKANRAIAGAINDTARHEKTHISRRIREEVNLKKKEVDQHLFVHRATPDKLAATIRLRKTDKVSLKDNFGARQTKKGVTYKINKKGGRTFIKSGFKNNTLGGHFFVRKFKNEQNGKGSGPLEHRLPIKKLHGPSPWAVFIRHDMKSEIHGHAQEYLDNRLRHRLEHTV